MHVCIHHYTKLLFFKVVRNGFSLLLPKNETHSPTTPSKTWLLPIFFPNLITFFCPKCSMLKSLLVPWTCQAFPCFSILHMLFSVSFLHTNLSLHIQLPSHILSQLKCPLKFFPSSFQLKKSHILRESVFPSQYLSQLIMILFYFLMSLSSHSKFIKAKIYIFLTTVYALNTVPSWYNKSSISVFWNIN